MKEVLRKKFLNIRKRYKGSIEDSIEITRKVLLLPEFRKAKSVLFYYPHKNEVDVRFLIKETLRENKKFVFLPKVSGQRIIPIKITSLVSLKRGFSGIKEPEGVEYSPDVIDLVFVPGVAFDIHGYRLGYGGGFYDRFLSETRAYKVGLAYDFQVVRELPVGKHDVPLDIIVTPTRIIKPKRKGGEES